VIAVGGVALGALLVGPLACRQLVGIGSSPETDLTTSACGLSYDTPSCASCASSSCCDESNACAADSACARVAECIGGCKSDDWSCRAQCLVETSGLGATFAAWEACTVRNCEGPCGLQCGALANGVPPETATACHDCFLTTSGACPLAQECSSSTDCLGTLACHAFCRTPDCQSSCIASYDAGAGLLSSISSIFKGTCTESCATSGSNWSCLGSVAWPAVTGTTTLSGQAIDVYSNDHVSGLDVTICRFADNVCNSGLGHATTDSNGNWNAQVMPGLAADSFAQFTSAATASKSIVPELKFIGYPVSEPQAPIALPGGVNLVATLDEYRTYLAPTAVTWDPSLAWVAFVVHDCELNLARNVQVALEADGPQPDAAAPPSRYYESGSAYDFMATATDSNGQGGFVNVPAPGQYILKATVAGKTFSKGHVFVRPGTRSVLYMYPMPASALP
jgi:hypothetical protein